MSYTSRIPLLDVSAAAGKGNLPNTKLIPVEKLQVLPPHRWNACFPIGPSSGEHSLQLASDLGWKRSNEEKITQCKLA